MRTQAGSLGVASQGGHATCRPSPLELCVFASNAAKRAPASQLGTWAVIPLPSLSDLESQRVSQHRSLPLTSHPP